ncbi:MFS transporter [Marisediminicola sp. LYQ134]|uniref:MFS transporter n=1 Tax=unclassified Marisediminicola TaxID=2618316 RepID=UPI003983D243
MNSRRSWFVWGIAVSAYIVAVFQRTSLGVAGVDAAERFGVSASVLSTLAVVQLVVYAALQVPVGVILDRLGARFLIISGAVFMAAGQATLAFAPDIGFAILGRVLVGAGDALTFISVIRLLSGWFEGRILPQVSQWTGNIGQLGQVLSAVPLSALLVSAGWEPSFVAAASLSLLAGILVVVVVRNAPPGTPRDENPVRSWRESMSVLRAALARPGTQLGFWSHFVTQSPGTMLVLLWGFPMLTAGLGYDRAAASALLTLFVAAGVVSGPIIGILTARFPLRRSNLVLAIVVGIGIAWTATLAWPGQPPLWLIVVLFITLGVGGPGSLIGFDFARTFNPMRSLGSANGVVNVGGFTASFIMMFLVGVVLDALGSASGGEPVFTWEAFRVAFLVQYLVIGTGLVFVIRVRRRTRRQLHEDEGIEVAPLWVVVARRWRRKSEE